VAFAVAPLCKQHHRDTFECGEAELDLWLAKLSLQQQDKGLSRTFVLLDEDRPDILAGFYSLTADALSPATFPEAFSRRYPGQYPIPAIRLVRVARNIALKGQAVGELLLVDALNRMVSASDQIGVAVIVVDAKSDHAKSFYVKYGFKPFPDNAMMLWLRIVEARNATQKNQKA
jgi:hypothetical protein